MLFCCPHKPSTFWRHRYIRGSVRQDGVRDPSRAGKDGPVLRGEHVWTTRQGNYTYTILVEGRPASAGFDWKIVRVSAMSSALVHAAVVAEGWARNREKAVGTAEALIKAVMKQNVDADTGEHPNGARSHRIPTAM